MAESEMVERGAEAHFLDGISPPRGCPFPTWENQPPAVKAAHRRKARAVIEAMRDPPAHVLDAMNPSGRYAGVVIPEAWNDAIGAALSPSTKEKSNG